MEYECLKMFQEQYYQSKESGHVGYQGFYLNSQHCCHFSTENDCSTQQQNTLQEETFIAIICVTNFTIVEIMKLYSDWLFNQLCVS